MEGWFVELSRSAPKAVDRQDARKREAHGPAYTVGWRCFLALVALTPLVMGVFPTQIVALAQFRALDSVALPTTVMILALLGLSFAAFCLSVVRGESELHWHPVVFVLVGLCGWATVSTLLSASPAAAVLGAYDSNEGLVAIFGYALVAFLAIQYVRSTRALRTLMVTAVVSGSLVAAYALLQYWGVDPLAYTSGMDRVVSTFGNADMLGTYLVFPLMLALGLALSARRGWNSLGYWAAVALTASAIVATATRGAWIGALAGLVCVGVGVRGTTWRASHRQKLVVAGAVVAAATAVAAAIVMIRPRHASSAKTLTSVLASLSNGRTVIWLTGLRGWLAHPIVGWGPDGFGRAFESAVGSDWYALVDGLQTAGNAHGFLVQTLVTLGIVGLALTVWALAQTAVESSQGLRSVQGSSRTLLLALLGAFVGLVGALTFGVTLPSVSVWLWLTVGLLLAPVSHRVSAPPRSVLVAGVALGLALSLWVGSWMVADSIAGWGEQQPTGPGKISAIEAAVRVNPISPTYRWLAAEALIDQAFAEQSAGQDPQTVTTISDQAISAYYVAVTFNAGDATVRVALADILLRYAATHPGSDAAQRAVQVALEAAKLAPHNPAVLGALARSYQAAGRLNDAEATARLARTIAPAYSMQTLGSLGAETTTTP